MKSQQHMSVSNVPCQKTTSEPTPDLMATFPQEVGHQKKKSTLNLKLGQLSHARNDVTTKSDIVCSSDVTSEVKRNESVVNHLEYLDLNTSAGSNVATSNQSKINSVWGNRQCVSRKLHIA